MALSIVGGRHTRSGRLFDFPRGEEPLVKSFALRIVARGHQRAHIQHGAHMRAPPRSADRGGPTVAIAGRHADEGRDVLPCERPQRGKFPQQRTRTHGPNALGTLQQIIVLPHSGLARSVVARSLSSGAMSALSHVIWATISCVRRSLVPARRCCSVVITIRCWRRPKGHAALASGRRTRPGCRADHVGTVGQGTGSHRIRLANCPWPGTIAGLPRVHDDHGEPAAAQASSPRAPGPQWLPGTLRVGWRSAPSPRASPPRWHHWRRPGVPQRAQGNIHLGFGHINPYKTGRPPTHSCPPDLAHTGSLAPDNGTGSGSPERDDPATLRSRRTKATSVSHVPGLRDGDAPTSPLKDTRLEAVCCKALLDAL